MRSILTAAFIVLLAAGAKSQHTFTATVKDAESATVLPGATAAITSLNLGNVADENGLVTIENIPDGTHSVQFSFVGYASKVLTINFPPDNAKPFEVHLMPDEEELEEITITSTRSSRTIADIPTRVEFIAGEELEEKANMKPGDLRLLLSESTGIQMQQTSATSANASIRIQGLDGRYTQILKDGFPLYAGFSGGLGLLQTPPLDLKQVEVIKGSSSTLYGGGAIAGLVNLISKSPSKERELSFLINGTSALGLDISGFYGQRFGKFGMTVYAGRNSTEPYDPADIDLSAIPKAERYTVNPRFFLDLSEKTKMNLGLNFSDENRIGGDIHYIEGKGDETHRYFESNDSRRYSTQFSFLHKLNDNTKLHIKNSFNHFERLVRIPDYTFDGVQNSSFTEINLSHNNETTEWIGGVNLWTDNFSEGKTMEAQPRSYDQTTFGAFIQNTTSFSPKVSLEAGLRGDYVINYGLALLPRVSLLYKVNEKLSSRFGGGLGYKAPTIFTEESERIQFQRVLPVREESSKLEKSYGANWDINYRTEIGDAGVTVNHLFFYTYLDNPLMMVESIDGDYEFTNLSGYTDSKGTETNVKIEYGDFKLFVGYTFTDAKIHNNGTTVRNPLAAKHRMNNVLMYEVEDQWKVGLEAYYFSRQRLNDDAWGKEYWICGVMVEKLWENFSLFINFENFLDARQTRFDTIYKGTVSHPVFRDIYAPVDGFVINGGLKLKL